jgi:hypothetical protein
MILYYFESTIVDLLFLYISIVFVEKCLIFSKMGRTFAFFLSTDGVLIRDHRIVVKSGEKIWLFPIS